MQGTRSAYELREFEGFELPYSSDTAILDAPVPIPGTGVTLKNAIATHPMEGLDCNPDGSPTEFTMHRAKLLAGSGASLIWTEAMAVTEDGKGNSHSQWITAQNLDGYKRLVDAMKRINPDAVIVPQLTHSGRSSKPQDKPAPIISRFNPHYMAVNLPEDYPVVTDDYLDRLQERFVEAAQLCQEAGFDGVDIKACHGYLLSELLSGYDRPGKYGGSYENRTRLQIEVIEGIRSACRGDFLLGCRFGLTDSVPYPQGFGMKADGSLEGDLEEPLRLAADMVARGVSLLNPSIGRINVNPAYTNGRYTQAPTETALESFNRFYRGAKALHEACPQAVVIGADYSALKGEAAYVATGAFAQGAVSMVGFGRNAIAYPGFAHDLLRGTWDAAKACVNCGQCFAAFRFLIPCGCPIRDEMYTPLYQERPNK